VSHVYAAYIESKADEYYSCQVHESLCNTQQPYQVPRNNRTGETYDVHIIQHCNCWLSINWEDLTLARKFEALRDLSLRFGLHSGACSRLKTTPITYRSRPETLRYGCDCWLSVDMRPDSPVDSDKTDQRKDHTMSDLSRAVTFAERFEQAKRDIHNFLTPFAKDYAAFIVEENVTGYREFENFVVETFEEVDNETFYIEGEQQYTYGEYTTPTMSLPFAFVENPQTFKAAYRAEQAERKAKEATKRTADKAAMVERLKAQLARAEAELAKADEQGDPIKLTANRNKAKELRAQFMEQG